MDLKDALAKARADLEAAEARREKLDAEIEEIETMITGLELALSRHGGRARRRPKPVAANGEWAEMSRTDAVIRALGTSREAIGPSDVTRILHDHGRDDERDVVTSTLAYLKGQNRVHSVGYGQWVAGPAPAVNGPSAGEET